MNRTRRITVPRPVRRAALGTAALAGAVLLAAAGCTSGRATTGSSPAASAAGSSGTTARALHWHSCSAGGANLQCASLRVPLDYARPGGRTITLALSRVAATAPASQQQGDLLVNPGGPGGSGLGLAASVADGLSPGVAADYNIIGFDPRGVGSSVPALSCDPSFFSGVRPDYIPSGAAAEQTLISRARSYAADCEKRYGWLLPYMTSRDAARDMDSIRAALGVPKISYFGYSYGTYLGQVYATLFPHRLRRMVLDSTVDPTGAWYADNIAQDYAFEGRMEAFFAWVAAHNATYGLGATPNAVDQAWYRARARLQAHPVDGRIGADGFDDTFLVGGYSNAVWPGLAAALAAYLRGGVTSRLASQYRQEGVQSENEFAVYNAVECSDVNWPRKLGQVELRHPPGVPDRAVPGLGQHLVQRRLRVLAGARARAPAADQGGRAAGDPDAPGHPGRGHPLRGCAGRAPAPAERQDGGRRGWREPRPVPRPATQQLCRRIPEPLPGYWRAA